ncbi:methyltransferase domain-containing protein [Polycladomyces sp. WAk]|uniref:Methyltransferase domain-containing protein n=2 Tax=Polycladomyces zharkentensis TaxID=2807616 RepID=A0ABS2WK87_9BACL|nr:methyltransferase domain-containing protein [Polycladomyces sp. WAk]
MMKPIDWKHSYVIVELGAGTGALTRYIQRWKKADSHALIFEKDTQLRNRLKTAYPDLLFASDARYLSRELHKHDLGQADCILSGLPFANFSPPLRDRILREVQRSLRPNGLFITFQYTLQMKQHLEQQFPSVEIVFTPWNIPPAFVYICRNHV